eukprot:GEMP01028773.1.p1 GENE.GEMP01028773.1~~GEMP01028773.1.p1  ORF type:complete len:561 (+),score=101.33 GEMP01028773.1:408-2090(+)
MTWLNKSDPKATVVASLNVACSRKGGDRVSRSKQIQQVESWVKLIKVRADFILMQGAYPIKSGVMACGGGAPTNGMLSECLLASNMSVSKPQNDASKTFGLITATRMPILEEWRFVFKAQGQDKTKQGVVFVFSQDFIVGNVALSGTEHDGFITRKQQVLELLEFYNSVQQQASTKGFNVEGSIIGGNWCIDPFGDDDSAREYRWLVRMLDQIQLRDVWTETGHLPGGSMGDEPHIEGATKLPDSRVAKGSRMNMLFTSAVVETAAAHFPDVCKDTMYFSMNLEGYTREPTGNSSTTQQRSESPESKPCVSNNAALYTRLHTQQVVASALSKSIRVLTPTSLGRSHGFAGTRKDSTDTVVHDGKSSGDKTVSSTNTKKTSSPRRRMIIDLIVGQEVDESEVTEGCNSPNIIARGPGALFKSLAATKHSPMKMDGSTRVAYGHVSHDAAGKRGGGPSGGDIASSLRQLLDSSTTRSSLSSLPLVSAPPNFVGPDLHRKLGSNGSVSRDKMMHSIGSFDLKRPASPTNAMSRSSELSVVGVKSQAEAMSEWNRLVVAQGSNC